MKKATTHNTFQSEFPMQFWIPLFPCEPRRKNISIEAHAITYGMFGLYRDYSK